MICCAIVLCFLFSTLYSEIGKIHSGSYAGISIGRYLATGEQLFKHHTKLAPQDSHIFNSKLSSNSFAMSLFCGYGLKLKDAWIAAEFSYKFDKLKTKDIFRFDDLTADKILQSESKSAWGGSIHLGFVVNSCLAAYLIGGTEIRTFKVRFIDNAIPKNASPVLNKKYTSIAFVPGIGARIALSKNFSVCTEYKYAMHRDKIFNKETYNVSTLDIDKIVVRHRSSVHSINIGVIYNFKP